jgi:hypothetical protein
MHASARPFSRLQSSQNPSPSGVGRSIVRGRAPTGHAGYNLPLDFILRLGRCNWFARWRCRRITLRSSNTVSLMRHVEDPHLRKQLSARSARPVPLTARFRTRLRLSDQVAQQRLSIVGEIPRTSGVRDSAADVRGEESSGVARKGRPVGACRDCIR